GNVSRNDDPYGVEDGPLNLVGGGPNAILDGAHLISVQMADDVLNHYHSAVHHHAEIQCSQRQQIGGNMLEVQTDRRKQQRKRDGCGNDQRSPDIPEEEKQDDDNQRHALPQIVQYGVAGEMNEIAAVYKRYNLSAAGHDSAG